MVLALDKLDEALVTEVELKWIVKPTWDGSWGDFWEEEEGGGGGGCELDGTVSGGFSAIGISWMNVNMKFWDLWDFVSTPKMKLDSTQSGCDCSFCFPRELKWIIALFRGTHQSSCDT